MNIMNISTKFQCNRIKNKKVVHISKQRLLFSFILAVDLFASFNMISFFFSLTVLVAPEGHEP